MALHRFQGIGNAPGDCICLLCVTVLRDCPISEQIAWPWGETLGFWLRCVHPFRAVVGVSDMMWPKIQTAVAL